MMVLSFLSFQADEYVETVGNRFVRGTLMLSKTLSRIFSTNLSYVAWQACKMRWEVSREKGRF